MRRYLSERCKTVSEPNVREQASRPKVTAIEALDEAGATIELPARSTTALPAIIRVSGSPACEVLPAKCTPEIDHVLPEPDTMEVGANVAVVEPTYVKPFAFGVLIASTKCAVHCNESAHNQIIERRNSPEDLHWLAFCRERLKQP